MRMSGSTPALIAQATLNLECQISAILRSCRSRPSLRDSTAWQSATLHRSPPPPTSTDKERLSKLRPQLQDASLDVSSKMASRYGRHCYCPLTIPVLCTPAPAIACPVSRKASQQRHLRTFALETSTTALLARHHVTLLLSLAYTLPRPFGQSARRLL